MVTGKKITEKQLVSVEVEALKEKLNHVYQVGMLMGHKNGRSGSLDSGLFTYLWDLKEKAIVEHKAQVDVPTNWLEELDQGQSHRAH
jgi:hypothetical protein